MSTVSVNPPRFDTVTPDLDGSATAYSHSRPQSPFSENSPTNYSETIGLTSQLVHGLKEEFSRLEQTFSLLSVA
jgi:hypothetical protein